MSLPMPPVREWGPLVEPPRFFHYVVDTAGKVPPIQEGHIEEVGPATIFTPQFSNLQIYGREVGSSYDEDQDGLQLLARRGRVMGEWFSVECVEGELGSMALEEVEEISAERFSAAYERQWR
jgi:hypothetical protein